MTDIFYFETVDRKNFAYTTDACFKVKEALKDIIEEYQAAGYYISFFRQIKKANKILEEMGE